MQFRIATWNINSVRLRLGLVERFVAEFAPDVLCLQEIKCRNEDFPLAALMKLGFPFIEVNGQAGYHGVATLSCLPMSRLFSQQFCGADHARHLATALPTPGGEPVVIHNVYIPSGGDIPDMEVNAKFRQKLLYLERMAGWFSEPANRSEQMIILGDFNVAPLENDVWSHKQLLNVVSHTPIEVEHLERLRASAGWVDPMRLHIPPTEKLYTWWSYRARDWRASNRGRRLDHIWVSAPLGQNVHSVTIADAARDWPQPSDHVPVIADVRIP